MPTSRATTPAAAADLMRAAARPERRRRFSWLWAALVVSLAANAFVIGHVVVDHLGQQRRDPQAHILRMELRYLADRLPPAATDKVVAALQTLNPDIAARLDRLKTLRAELDQLAAVPAPDRAAIDAHLRDIRLEVGAMQEQVQSRTFDALLALPPADRAPLAQPAQDN